MNISSIFKELADWNLAFDDDFLQVFFVVAFVFLVFLVFFFRRRRLASTLFGFSLFFWGIVFCKHPLSAVSPFANLLLLLSCFMSLLTSLWFSGTRALWFASTLTFQASPRFFGSSLFGFLFLLILFGWFASFRFRLLTRWGLPLFKGPLPPCFHYLY